MINNIFDAHLPDEVATGRIAQFLRRMAALQLLGMERRPEASIEGIREAGQAAQGMP